jgi:hypothetical protein
MANSVRLNVVVSDAEMVATVLQQVQRSSLNGEVTVTVQPSASQRVRVSGSDIVAGEARHKFIQGL